VDDREEAALLTIGVEEEFILVDDRGAVAPVAGRLLGRGERIVGEYMTYQVETTSPVCTRLDELAAELYRLRLAASGRAAAAGARLVATGAPPFGAGPLDAVSDSPRYRELARRYPQATRAGGSCSCHVHVGLPDRNLAVQVLARLRAWLPVLLAVTVNSPFMRGMDTGWSSMRYPAQLRWPTFRLPEAYADADAYDRTVATLIACGAALDAPSVYFLARLSHRYPTLEIRVGDAGLTVDDTVLYAGLVRAIVESLVSDIRRGVPSTPVPRRLLGAILIAVAHYGLSERRIHLPTPVRSSWCHPTGALLTTVAGALAESGDLDTVQRGLARLHSYGTGADRQRAMRASAGTPEEFVALLAAETLRPPAPHQPHKSAIAAAPTRR
jgi:carboxylate-amine ligase